MCVAFSSVPSSFNVDFVLMDIDDVNLVDFKLYKTKSCKRNGKLKMIVIIAPFEWELVRF